MGNRSGENAHFTYPCYRPKLTVDRALGALLAYDLYRTISTLPLDLSGRWSQSSRKQKRIHFFGGRTKETDCLPLMRCEPFGFLAAITHLILYTSRSKY